jgi:hypothetical protein
MTSRGARLPWWLRRPSGGELPQRRRSAPALADEKRRKRRLLVTTNTLEKAIARPASIGFGKPAAGGPGDDDVAVIDGVGLIRVTDIGGDTGVVVRCVVRRAEGVSDLASSSVSSVRSAIARSTNPRTKACERRECRGSGRR